MIQGTGERLGEYLHNEIKISSEQVEIVKYGLEVLISTLAGILVALIVGAICGVFKETLVVVVVVATLRIFAGGAHCVTPVPCVIITGIVFPVLGLLSFYLEPLLSPYFEFFLGLVLIISMLSVYYLAPVDTPEKPIRTKKHRNKLRNLSMISALLVIAFTYFAFLKLPFIKSVMVASGLGIIWECFILTKVGHKTLAVLEKGLDNI